MELKKEHDEFKFPFPIPTDRFDQKNEMFKRSLWDEKMRPHARGFYEEVLYEQAFGWILSSDMIDYNPQRISGSLKETIFCSPHIDPRSKEPRLSP
jgi:hypothetical protein